MRPVCVTTPLTPHRDLDRGSLASLSAYIQAGARREDAIEGAAIVCDVTVASASKENGCCVPKPPLQIAAVSAQAPRGLIAPPPPPAPCPLIRARTEAKARTEARRMERTTRRDAREVRITQLTESERKTKRALLAARDRFRVAELAAEDARLKARDVNDGKDAALARSTRALAVGVGDIACLTASLNEAEARCVALEAENVDAALRVEEATAAREAAIAREAESRDALGHELETSRAETKAAIERGERAALTARSDAETKAKNVRLELERASTAELTRMSARLETTKATLERELRANEDFVEVVKRHESRALDLTRRLNEAKRECDEHASLAESFEGKAVDRDEVRTRCESLQRQLVDSKRANERLCEDAERFRAASAMERAEWTRREAALDDRVKEFESSLVASRRDAAAASSDAKASRRDELRSQERAKALEIDLEACEKSKADHETRRNAAVATECSALSRLDDSARQRADADAARDSAAKRLVTVERKLADTTRRLKARGDVVESLERSLLASRTRSEAKDTAVARSETDAETAKRAEAAGQRALASEREASAALRHARDTLAARHDDTLVDLERARAQLCGSERAKGEAESALRQSAERIVKLDGEIVGLAGERDSLTENLAKETTKHAEALASLETSHAELARVIAETKRSREELTRVQGCLEDVKIKETKLARELDAKVANERRLDERCECLAALANDLGNECARLTEHGEGLTKETSALRAELLDAAEAMKAEAGRGKLRERFAEDLRRKLTASEATVETLRASMCAARFVPIEQGVTH